MGVGRRDEVAKRENILLSPLLTYYYFRLDVLYKHHYLSLMDLEPGDGNRRGATAPTLTKPSMCSQGFLSALSVMKPLRRIW